MEGVEDGSREGIASARQFRRERDANVVIPPRLCGSSASVTDGSSYKDRSRRPCTRPKRRWWPVTASRVMVYRLHRIGSVVQAGTATSARHGPSENHLDFTEAAALVGERA